MLHCCGVLGGIQGGYKEERKEKGNRILDAVVSPFEHGKTKYPDMGRGTRK
jgi:hypothetical protein